MQRVLSFFFSSDMNTKFHLPMPTFFTLFYAPTFTLFYSGVLSCYVPCPLVSPPQAVLKMAFYLPSNDLRKFKSKPRSWLQPLVAKRPRFRSFVGFAVGVFCVFLFLTHLGRFWTQDRTRRPFIYDRNALSLLQFVRLNPSSNPSKSKVATWFSTTAFFLFHPWTDVCLFLSAAGLMKACFLPMILALGVTVRWDWEQLRNPVAEKSVRETSTSVVNSRFTSSFLGTKK